MRNYLINKLMDHFSKLKDILTLQWTLNKIVAFSTKIVVVANQFLYLYTKQHCRPVYLSGDASASPGLGLLFKLLHSSTILSSYVASKL